VNIARLRELSSGKSPSTASLPTNEGPRSAPAASRLRSSDLGGFEQQILAIFTGLPPVNGRKNGRKFHRSSSAATLSWSRPKPGPTQAFHGWNKPGQQTPQRVRHGFPSGLARERLFLEGVGRRATWPRRYVKVCRRILTRSSWPGRRRDSCETRLSSPSSLRCSHARASSSIAQMIRSRSWVPRTAAGTSSAPNSSSAPQVRAWNSAAGQLTLPSPQTAKRSMRRATRNCSPLMR